MPDVPGFVTVVFILTAFATVGIFLFAIVKAGVGSLSGKFLVGFLTVWLIVQAVLANAGFFQNHEAVPPRVFAFGVMPFAALTIVYLIFFRKFLDDLSLRLLTIIHIIRLPVELTLLWLYQSGQVPIDMTFEGRNFDIVSGITAPIVYFLAFRNGRVNRVLLIVWNLAALLLLANIVTIAILAFPTNFQSIGINQPNVGVSYFPFIWLPAVIVPIVLFSHLASLYKLLFAPDHGAEMKS